VIEVDGTILYFRIRKEVTVLIKAAKFAVMKNTWQF
jgi:hypothetical protein